jgi:hypothetical protein
MTRDGEDNARTAVAPSRAVVQELTGDAAAEALLSIKFLGLFGTLRLVDEPEVAARIGIWRHAARCPVGEDGHELTVWWRPVSDWSDWSIVVGCNSCCERPEQHAQLGQVLNLCRTVAMTRVLGLPTAPVGEWTAQPETSPVEGSAVAD